MPKNFRLPTAPSAPVATAAPPSTDQLLYGAVAATPTSTPTPTPTPTPAPATGRGELLPPDALVPYSTAISVANYVKVSQLEYWDRTDKQDITNAALTEYLAKFPNAGKMLPEKERQQLHNLKKLRG